MTLILIRPFGNAATMYSPWGKYNVRRDIGNDGKEGIVSLEEFLSYAKNNSGIGAYVNIQVSSIVKSYWLPLIYNFACSISCVKLTNGMMFLYPECLFLAY